MDDEEKGMLAMLGAGFVFTLICGIIFYGGIFLIAVLIVKWVFF